MAVETQETPSGRPVLASVALPEVIIYGHSWLLYWWPVWVVGYVLALLIWLHPVQVQIGDRIDSFSANRNLGVIYTLLLVLMIVVTSSNVRGMASALVVAALAFSALLFAYLDWWPVILGWLGNLTIFMNLGFYLFFSTALFLVWLMTVFVIDHMSYWRIRAGQVTHEYVLGAVDQSYDTETMMFTKNQSDIFRHWILGLGSGDLQMATMGGRGIHASVQNVVFVNAKMAEIQRLIATKEVAEET